jgi:4'-phosphopantetheinyl transferase
MEVDSTGASAYHRRVGVPDETAETAARRRPAAGSGATAELPPGEVHLFRASLERPLNEVAELRSLLSHDEIERAERMRFDRDRSRYIVGRGQLRTLLAAYTGVPARRLRFEYGEFDKPSVDGGPAFNLSHSGAVALYAFAREGDIGVDVELEDERFGRDRIAERFFSPGEVRTLRGLPPEQQPLAFLSCWTRKEAFIKARGDGLSLALDSFDVTLAPGAPARLLRTSWCKSEPARWVMADLSDRRSGYVGALAFRGNGCRIVEQRLSDTSKGAMPGRDQR